MILFNVCFKGLKKGGNEYCVNIENDSILPGLVLFSSRDFQVESYVKDNTELANINKKKEDLGTVWVTKWSFS